jgi:hypothetical protein
LGPGADRVRKFPATAGGLARAHADIDRNGIAISPIRQTAEKSRDILDGCVIAERE